MYQLETRKLFFLLSLLLGPKHCHINVLLYFLSKFIYHHYLILWFIILRIECRSQAHEAYMLLLSFSSCPLSTYYNHKIRKLLKIYDLEKEIQTHL